VQQAQAFAAEFTDKLVDARRITARVVQAGDQTEPNGIAAGIVSANPNANLALPAISGNAGSPSVAPSLMQALRLSRGTRQHRFLVATQVDYIRSTETGFVDS
jgi:hypothetical protein